MSKEAMKLALEALEENHHFIEEYERPDYLAHYDRVIGAIRKALAKQEQCTYPNCDYPCMNLPDCQEQKPVKWADYEPDGVHHNKQEQGEPVAWRDRNSGTLLHEEWLDADPLYTSSQQRTWVGLTFKERDHLWEVSRAGLPRYNTFAGLVEAKLKEKNT